MPDSVYGLLGPVNGVFCVAGLSEEVALLNPAMRQFKPLSLPCPDVQPDLWPFKNVVGFGLDPLSGDYKLVQIQYFYNDEMDGGHDSALVSVYNSGSDSWRHFEDVALVNSSHCVYGSLCNTYLDGLCYWLMEFDNGNVAAILAFDMTTEKFLEIKVPDCIKWKTGRLALCGDSLTLLSYDMNMNDKFFDIWVMGEEGCWTRSSTVGPFQDIQWPLCFWKNNELLFETGSSQLILHNVFTQKLRTVDLERNENGFSRHWGFSYKESLVSIKREGDNCILWDTSSDFVKYFFNLSSSNK